MKEFSLEEVLADSIIKWSAIVSCRIQNGSEAYLDAVDWIRDKYSASCPVCRYYTVPVKVDCGRCFLFKKGLCSDIANPELPYWRWVYRGDFEAARNILQELRYMEVLNDSLTKWERIVEGRVKINTKAYQAIVKPIIDKHGFTCSLCCWYEGLSCAGCFLAERDICYSLHSDKPYYRWAAGDDEMAKVVLDAIKEEAGWLLR